MLLPNPNLKSSPPWNRGATDQSSLINKVFSRLILGVLTLAKPPIARRLKNTSL